MWKKPFVVNNHPGLFCSPDTNQRGSNIGEAKLTMSSGWYCTLGALVRQCRASQNEWGAMELHQTFCHCSGLNWKYFFIVFFLRAGYNFLTNATLFRFLTSLDLFKRSLFVVIASSVCRSLDYPVVTGSDVVS